MPKSMQKSGLLIVIFGILIVGGLITSVIENQVTLEGIKQGNGKVTTSETVTVSVDMHKEETPRGIFAVQIMEFEKNTISAKIIDPTNIEIISQDINEQFIEKEFEIFESGTYQLVIQSTTNEEIYVTGAIGPLPDTDKKFILSIISFVIIVVGMMGLLVSGIYEIRNRKKLV